MQDTKAFIADVEADIARTEQTLGALEGLAREVADEAFELPDEMRDAFDRFEVLCSAAAEHISTELPAFAIRI